MSMPVQRVLAAVVILVAGIASLPVVAAFLDGGSTQGWIIPVQLLLMALVGAGVAVALPALARAGAPTMTRALSGAAWGLLAALLGLLVFWLLLNGFDGP